MDKSSSAFTFWRELGLSVRAANILVNLSCESLADVRRVGSGDLLRQHGMGPPTYNEIARLLGWAMIDAPAKRRIRRQAVEKPPDANRLSEAGVKVVGYMIGHKPV